jgi:hypothetical protein
MSRDIATVIANTLDDEVMEPFFAVDLEFDSGTLRFWTGVGTKSINGEDYIGAGAFLGISEIQETAEIAAAGATLALSGIPAELLSLALTEPYQNRRCIIYFGVIAQGPVALLTEDDDAILTEADDLILLDKPPSADMAILFIGTMDRMDIEEGAETSTIRLAVENRLLDLERARVRRYTNNDQQSRFPGDRGLEFVETIQDRDLFWGRKPD